MVSFFWNCIASDKFQYIPNEQEEKKTFLNWIIQSALSLLLGVKSVFFLDSIQWILPNGTTVNDSSFVFNLLLSIGNTVIIPKQSAKLETFSQFFACDFPYSTFYTQKNKTAQNWYAHVTMAGIYRV